MCDHCFIGKTLNKNHIYIYLLLFCFELAWQPLSWDSKKIFKILSCQLYFHTTNHTLKDLFTRHNTFWKSLSSSPVLKATIRDTIQKVKLLLSTPILLQNWKIVALQMNKTKLTISLEDEVTFCVPQNKIIVLRFKCFLSENLAKKMDFCVLFVYIIIDKL